MSMDIFASIFGIQRSASPKEISAEHRPARRATTSAAAGNARPVVLAPPWTVEVWMWGDGFVLRRSPLVFEIQTHQLSNCIQNIISVYSFSTHFETVPLLTALCDPAGASSPFDFTGCAPSDFTRAHVRINDCDGASSCLMIRKTGPGAAFLEGEYCPTEDVGGA